MVTDPRIGAVCAFTTLKLLVSMTAVKKLLSSNILQWLTGSQELSVTIMNPYPPASLMDLILLNNPQDCYCTFEKSTSTITGGDPAFLEYLEPMSWQVYASGTTMNSNSESFMFDILGYSVRGRKTVYSHIYLLPAWLPYY